MMERAKFLGASNVAYVTARVGTKTMGLLTKEEMARMREMSVPQMLKTLHETVYKREIEESAPMFRFSSADVIEHAVNLNLGRTYRQVNGYARGPLKGGISAYILYWDVWNLKTILRGLNSGSSKDYLISHMVFGGSLPEQFWTRAMDQKDNLVDHFKGTPFHTVLKHHYGRDDLATLEDRLDRMYYDHLYDHALHRHFERSDKIFLQFVRKEIDLRNLSSAVKIMYFTPHSDKAEHVSHLSRRSFIRNGWSLDSHRFQELSGAPDIETILEKSAGLWYEETLRAIVESKGGFSSRYYLGRIERSVMSIASSYSVRHPLSILPVLSFLLRKRAEVENIRIIARARSQDLTSEEISELTWM
jgi:V/A-type H+-transporting ATPase subunit C